MGYRWLENYHSNSEVIETAPNVYSVALKDSSGRAYPLFGVSSLAVERALERGEAQQKKLTELLEKMRQAKGGRANV